MAAINQLGGMPGQSEQGVPQKKTGDDENSISGVNPMLEILS